MPKVHCKHCPIIEFCNINPILVNRPTGKQKGGKPVNAKVRLCPILIAIGRTIRKAPAEI